MSPRPDPVRSAEMERDKGGESLDLNDVVARAKAALEAMCSSCEAEPCGWLEMQFAEDCRELVPELVAEIERLRAGQAEAITRALIDEAAAR